ncbi:hypothetical protein [Priestia megaterium]|uniref:hypothetical protein n=1 Tax=Priestia megaterium TaxID=1404 RepID=UPI0024531687|nr:hypothetical protein [Priestia megaterium]MDH3144367.1 hypothetical protein [Priestia megaterium]MED4240790.1 hypothetical protein [Priestia megaterium]MED4253367.1 hypothetical protein [Priestia megaterium]MED4267776.1 hypothetical protein [Priestia megaterium]MED4278414.1 hypothetical protein [Priestia megaterium]
MKKNKKLKNHVDTYRPTVRYHSIYRTYVDSLFHATELDRNQIIRCALFTAANNPVFLALMNQYKVSDVPLPSSPWQSSSHPLWMEQEPNIEEKGGGKHDDLERKGTSTGVFALLGTSPGSQSTSGATNQPNQQSSTREKAVRITRRQQPIERRTREIPTLQLSNNGGIRLDLR